MSRIVIEKLDPSKDIRNGPTTVFTGNSVAITDIDLVIGSISEISGVFVTDNGVDRLVYTSEIASYFNTSTTGFSIEYVKASGNEDNVIVLSSGTLNFNNHGVLIGEI